MQSKQNLCLKLHVTSPGTHKQAVELVKIAFYVLRKKMWSVSHNMIAVHCCIVFFVSSWHSSTTNYASAEGVVGKLQIAKVQLKKKLPSTPSLFLEAFPTAVIFYTIVMSYETLEIPRNWNTPCLKWLASVGNPKSVYLQSQERVLRHVSRHARWSERSRQWFAAFTVCEGLPPCLHVHQLLCIH